MKKFLKSLRDKYIDIKMCLKYPGKGNSCTYMKYRPDFNFGGKKVLNLGCGTSTYAAPNVVNLDAYDAPGVNFKWDLSKTPLPFEDNTFDFIIANHILEHVPNWWECFKECARVLKVGGILEVWLPGDGTESQQGYRDHINYINRCSFTGIRGTFRNYANAFEIHDRKNHGAVIDLEEVAPHIVRLQNYIWIHIWPASVKAWISRHLRNTVAEMRFVFRKCPPETRSTSWRDSFTVGG